MRIDFSLFHCFILHFTLKCKILTIKYSLFQQAVSPQKVDTLSLEHLIEFDVEKFNKTASDLQAIIRDELNIPENSHDLLVPIEEELKKCVRILTRIKLLAKERSYVAPIYH